MSKIIRRQKILEKIHLAVRTEFFEANRKNMEFLADDIEEIVEKAEEMMWANLIHTTHNPGDVVGHYKIVERIRRIGKNTKFRVMCTLCSAPMFRYSNKFRLNHKDCPAIQEPVARGAETSAQPNNGHKEDV